MKHSWAICLLLGLTIAARGDGGHLQLQQASGPFIITLFTAPEPLTVGSAEFSAMVQDGATQETLVDASIDVRLRSPEGKVETIHLVHGKSGNRLLESAAVQLGVPGAWDADVVVQRGLARESCSTAFRVQPGFPRRKLVLIYVILPVVIIGLFLGQQAHLDRIRRHVQARTSRT